MSLLSELFYARVSMLYTVCRSFNIFITPPGRLNSVKNISRSILSGLHHPYRGLLLRQFENLCFSIFIYSVSILLMKGFKYTVSYCIYTYVCGMCLLCCQCVALILFISALHQSRAQYRLFSLFEQT